MEPAEAERVERIFGNKASKGEPFDSLEHIMIHKNGAHVVMEVTGTPFFGEDGKPLGYRTISHDITRRKEAAEALARAEANYRDIFETAVEGIYRSVPAGRYTDANPAFARIFGYDSPEELRTAVNDIGRQLYADPDVRRECVRIVEERGHGSFEIEIRRKDGSTGWVFNNVRAVRDPQGKTVCYEGFVEDITDRKQMEEELRKTHGALEERVRERTAELARVNEVLRLDIEKRMRVSAQSASLTQTEIQIANFIMQGTRSKEIAGLMKLSKGTIDFYRNNIRKKLGIRNQKANLQSYLLAHFKI